MTNFRSLALIIVTLCSSTLQATTFFVKENASPGGNGTSWVSAFNNLDSALNAASSSSSTDQIWVAKGTYKPSISFGGGYNGTEPNLKTFLIPANVAIYGGFNGKEKNLSQRNPSQNPTILSGDLGGGIKAWHIVTVDGGSGAPVTGVILDGLIIRDGNATGPDAGTLVFTPGSGSKIVTLDYAFDSGGGLFARHGAKVTLNNMILMNNNADSAQATLFTPGFTPTPVVAGGGAVGIADAGTFITITNSSFNGNRGVGFGTNGGAISAIKDSGFAISNTAFSGNKVSRLGGAVHLRDAVPSTLTGCTFVSNETAGSSDGDTSGGAVGSFDSNLTVSSCVFNFNKSTSAFGAGGAIFFHVPFDDGEAT